MQASTLNPVRLVSAFMLSAALTAGAQTQSFSDNSTGVTFRYPQTWALSKSQDFYLPSPLVPGNATRLGAAVWKAGNMPKTTLTGLQFLAAVEQKASKDACLHPHEEGSTEPPKVDSVTVNGVIYAHTRAEDAGMCHQVKDDVYTTYHNHSCYLFDLTVHTICSGVVDGMRDATPAELADADAKLMGILKTVTILNPQTAAIH